MSDGLTGKAFVKEWSVGTWDWQLFFSNGDEVVELSADDLFDGREEARESCKAWAARLGITITEWEVDGE